MLSHLGDMLSHLADMLALGVSWFPLAPGFSWFSLPLDSLHRFGSSWLLLAPPYFLLASKGYNYASIAELPELFVSFTESHLQVDHDNAQACKQEKRNRKNVTKSSHVVQTQKQLASRHTSAKHHRFGHS